MVCHTFLTCARNCYLFTHFVSILMGSWASQCLVWINRALPDDCLSLSEIKVCRFHQHQVRGFCLDTAGMFAWAGIK